MIQRILSGLLGLVFIALTFIFASFILAVALTAGLLLAGWMWWRARNRVQRSGSRVIEGEYRIIEPR
jgi:hypothetical protein